MRPSRLDPLFAGLRGLEGVGPKVEALLTRLTRPTHEGDADAPARVIDLVLHLPYAVIDRRNRPPLAEAPIGEVVTLALSIERHSPPPPGSRAPHRVRARDASGEMDLVFFKASSKWLESRMPVGSTRHVSGRLEVFNERLQMVHPDHVLTDEELEAMPLVEPVYPLTGGLAQRPLAKLARAALARVPELDEWQDEAWRARKGWPGFRDALARAHAPESPADLEPHSPARARLAYDELLAGQLAIALVRARMRKARGRAVAGDGRLAARLLAGLPFAPTGAQERSIAEIGADLAAPHRMLRLLQGDVGSGKTLVALMAMAHVVEAGKQAALMAPTEILARQHFANIAPMAEGAGMTCALLTGREKAGARRAVTEALANGEVDIVVGTHALFQEDVAFRDLALAVVDEQHRFGVHQRLALTAKGAGVDLLVMTATPIPRTLVLSYYGDMDVSRLDEKPPGRRPIDTRIVSSERLADVVARLRAVLDSGARAYWVVPLVEDSQASDLVSAEQRHRELSAALGSRVGLVHGRMRGAEKDAAMADFASGQTRLLVATTVIEVGVDVPDATIIVIEHAERFGLSQLHQLRGRVGRGAQPSTCLLVYRPPLGEAARARLSVLRESEDGFRIAEEDLRLRGEGDLLGTRQSGDAGHRLARLEDHADLMEAARDDARLIVERDRDLTSPRGQALRLLLYLFEQDQAIRLLHAG